MTSAGRDWLLLPDEVATRATWQHDRRSPRRSLQGSQVARSASVDRAQEYRYETPSAPKADVRSGGRGPAADAGLLGPFRVLLGDPKPCWVRAIEISGLILGRAML